MTEAVLARAVRSGLEEATYRGHAVRVEADGSIADVLGDPDHAFFLRSTAKPFQAAVSQANGAELGPIQLAVACSSHSAEPIHIAVTHDMLAEVGLDVGALACPPSRPMSRTADRRLAARASLDSKAIMHNCSGKHAAALRACVASGWSLDYTAPNHPVQQAMVEFVAELTGDDPTPLGVDGCGFPTMRSTLVGLARGFAALSLRPELVPIWRVMHRYPALTAGSRRPETRIAIATDTAVKGGAMGSIGVSLRTGGAIAAKSADGDIAMAALGAITMLRRAGQLSTTQSRRLQPVAQPTLLGGGEPVGSIEPIG